MDWASVYIRDIPGATRVGLVHGDPLTSMGAGAYVYIYTVFLHCIYIERERDNVDVLIHIIPFASFSLLDM